MLITSARARLRHEVLRPSGSARRLDAGGSGSLGSPSSHSRTEYRYSCRHHSSPAKARRATKASSEVVDAGITAA